VGTALVSGSRLHLVVKNPGLGGLLGASAQKALHLLSGDPDILHLLPCLKFPEGSRYSKRMPKFAIQECTGSGASTGKSM
jgi:hypothetical protein